MTDQDKANTTAEFDALIRAAEMYGATWHVIGGSKVVPAYLAFEFPNKGDPKLALSAMAALDKAFRASAETRKAVIDHALSIGAFYIEFGNDKPVIGEGETVQ